MSWLELLLSVLVAAAGAGTLMTAFPSTPLAWVTHKWIVTETRLSRVVGVRIMDELPTLRAPVAGCCDIWC